MERVNAMSSSFTGSSLSHIHRTEHRLVQELLRILHAGVIEGSSSRRSLRLLTSNTIDIHSFYIDQSAFNSSHGRTLRLVADGVPLETIVVRAIVEIALRLV